MGITTKGNGRVVFGSRIPPFINTYSLDFDGVDNNIPILNTTQTVSWASNLSYSCWIKTTEIGVYQQYKTAFGGRSNGGSVYDLGKLVTPFLSSEIFVGGGTTPLNDGVWHHLVTTFNYTTKEVIRYVDGSPEGFSTYPGYITHYNVSIGSNGFGLYYYEGNVDECALWRSILTPLEITSIYNSGTPNDLTPLSPYGWWRMGDKATYDGTNWALVDQGSGGNNGNSVNMDLIDRVPDTPPS